MTDRCVLAGYTVDEQAARLTGVFVFFGALLFLAVPSEWVAAVMALDFVPRAFGAPHRSLLVQVSRRILRWMQADPAPVDAGPKQFAARLGLGMTVTMSLMAALGYGQVAMGLAAVLAVCAALEGFVGFCVGCTMYSLLMRLKERMLGSQPGF